MTDYRFSERFAIIFMTNWFMHEKIEIPGLGNDTGKILQDVLNKSGGNITLNKKLYARDIDVDAEQIELGAYEPGNLDSEY